MEQYKLNGGPVALPNDGDGIFVTDKLEGGFAFDSGEMRVASNAHERLEGFIGSSLIESGVALTPEQVPDHIMATASSATPDYLRNASVVDPTIAAIMRLAEYYMVSEGDVRQTIQATVDVGIKELRVRHKDEGVRRQYIDILDSLDLAAIARSIWLTSIVYGTSWPAEFWDGLKKRGNSLDFTGAIPSISLLNPKHVAPSLMSVGIGQYTYAPTQRVYDDIARGYSVPDWFYNNLGTDWNESMTALRGIPLNAELVMPVRDTWFMHSLFPVPMIAGAQRQLSTRQILEEMIRSTIEGVKTQLWIFAVKDPRAGEVDLLKATLAGNRGSRTGYLVWSDNLNVKQFVPLAIDELLANETWLRMTHAVFRALGLFMRASSGESPNTGSSSGGSNNPELDLTIWVDRMNTPRQKVQRFLTRFASHYAQSIGVAEPAKVELNPIGLSVRGQIRDRLVPLLNFGIPSVRTAFDIAGLDPDEEIASLKSEQTDGTRDLIKPYSGFSQLGPSGRTDSPQSQGNPPDRPETKKELVANASLEFAQASLASYEGEVLRQFDNAPGTQTADEFIDSLKGINDSNRADAYRAGYASGGGIADCAEERILAAQTWDQSNLESFRGDMQESPVWTHFRFRAQMYADEGWRVAYMMGMWQAKQEQGWRTWKRIPRPNACAACLDDARVMHPIDEEFWEPHPSGKCGYTFVRFGRGAILSAPMRVPFVINQQEEES